MAFRDAWEIIPSILAPPPEKIHIFLTKPLCIKINKDDSTENILTHCCEICIWATLYCDLGTNMGKMDFLQII